MPLILDALATLGRVFADTGRVLYRHWPQLVTLFLAGWAGRMSFLWLATVVSDVSPTVAVLLLPLAPLCTLLSLVLMLRATAVSLPAFADLAEGLPWKARVRDDFTVAGQVLLPFLAVYASAGLLAQDTRVFLHDTTADEFLNNNLGSIDWGRADYASGWLLAGLVVGAMAARKVISMLDLTKRHLAWAGVAVYLEVLWIMTFARVVTTEIERWTDWVTSRQAVVWIVEWYEAARAWLDSVSSWAVAFLDGIGAFLGGLGSVVLVPVAWLAIGAATYGHRLSGSALAVPTHEDMTRRIKQVPNPVRRVVSHAVEPVTTPVKSTLGAIGKIAAAGVLPMVLFCVVFVVANQLQVLAALAVRALIGPGEPLRQYALEPFAVMVERGVYFVVALSLLGAAVNAIVLGQHEDADRPAVSPAGRA